MRITAARLRAIRTTSPLRGSSKHKPRDWRAGRGHNRHRYTTEDTISGLVRRREEPTRRAAGNTPRIGETSWRWPSRSQGGDHQEAERHVPLAGCSGSSQRQSRIAQKPDASAHGQHQENQYPVGQGLRSLGGCLLGLAFGGAWNGSFGRKRRCDQYNRGHRTRRARIRGAAALPDPVFQIKRVAKVHGGRGRLAGRRRCGFPLSRAAERAIAAYTVRRPEEVENTVAAAPMASFKTIRVAICQEKPGPGRAHATW